MSRRVLALVVTFLLPFALAACSKKVTCGPGTTKRGSQCVAYDETLKADRVEAPEPNDTAATPAGTLPVPAIGRSVVLHGCIDPTGKGTAGDSDVWLLDATGPTVLEISVDGVGGLTSGFTVATSDPALVTPLANWRRSALATDGDTAHRQLYLPAAGSYSLRISDARTLFMDVAAGSPDACYFAKVRQVALPAATAVVEGENDSSSDGTVRVVAYTAQSDGELLTVALGPSSESQGPAFVALWPDGFKSVAQNGPGGAYSWLGGLSAGEAVRLVIDPSFVLSAGSQPSTLTLGRVAAQPLPTDGAGVTVTRRYPDLSNSYDDCDFLYFDVASAGTIVHFDLGASQAVSMYIVGRDLTDANGNLHPVATIAPFGGPGTTAFRGEYVRFLAPGRYHVMTATNAIAATYDVTATLTQVTPSALSWGVPLTAQPLPAAGSGFHTLAVPDRSWAEFSAAGAEWGAGAVRVTAYDLSGAGWLGSPAYPAVFTREVPATGDLFGRVLAGGLLLRVEPTDVPGTAPTYDLAVEDRPSIDLGTLVPGTPVARPADALAAGGVIRYLARAATESQLTAVLSPADGTVDISVARLDADEAVTATVNAGGAGESESLVVLLPAAPNDWIALQVTNESATATTVAGSFSVDPPPSYALTAGTLPFTNICAAGTRLLTNQDDTLTDWLTLPASLSGFQLYGVTVGASPFRVSSNGWVSWDPGGSARSDHDPIPLAGPLPNAFLAPYWEDLYTSVCQLDEADKVTFQWTGTLYSQPETVAFQLVLHDTGVIDFIYGADQEADGSGATIGLENGGATLWRQISYETVQSLPGTSWTLTPE